MTPTVTMKLSTEPVRRAALLSSGLLLRYIHCRCTHNNIMSAPTVYVHNVYNIIICLPQFFVCVCVGGGGGGVPRVL